jgi:hypothetical protein
MVVEPLFILIDYQNANNMTTKTIEYIVMIVEASHLIIHIKEDSIYKRNGNHLIGAVVSKLESTEGIESSL